MYGWTIAQLGSKDGYTGMFAVVPSSTVLLYVLGIFMRLDSHEQ